MTVGRESFPLPVNWRELVDHDRTPVSVALFDATRSSRRRLLARLAALPAAFGLGFFMEPESVAARKDKGKGRSGSSRWQEQEERQEPRWGRRVLA